MKTVILAAGRQKNLGLLLETISKVMLAVEKKPIR
jgi:choline kinase